MHFFLSLCHGLFLNFLRYLRLDDMPSITGTLPRSFFDLSSLEYIIIRDNGLLGAPSCPQLGDCSLLTRACAISGANGPVWTVCSDPGWSVRPKRKKKLGTKKLFFLDLHFFPSFSVQVRSALQRAEQVGTSQLL